MKFSKKGKKMIDIIIPVYNTPKEDLERCLNSILRQTFQSYNVYIIDDGSREETKYYLDNYVKDKQNFQVKHIENGGVSNARNIGINSSHSKYIAFVDADDTVLETFLEEAYNLIEENSLDCIIGGYQEIKNNEIIRTRCSLPGLHIYEGNQKTLFLEKLLSSKANERNKEIGDCPTGRIYTRLFKRESLKDLKFDTNVHMSEDTLFMIDYTYQADKIGVTDKIWYNYYINDYSISNGTKKDKLIQSIKGFIEKIEKRQEKETNPILKEAYEARIMKANNYIKELEEIYIKQKTIQ